MFKRHIGITPHPINNLFIVNNAQHSYYIRHINSLHTHIGKNEKVYKMFSFHRINIWNHMSIEINIDVSYAYYTKFQKGIFNGIRFHIESHKHLYQLKY